MVFKEFRNKWFEIYINKMVKNSSINDVREIRERKIRIRSFEIIRTLIVNVRIIKIRGGGKREINWIS